MSSLGSFELLPIEIREQIYTALYSSVMVHCCCQPNNHRNVAHECNGKLVDYYVRMGYDCAGTDIEPTLRSTSWYSTAMTSNGLIAGNANVFSFLQTSKTIWQEAELIAWQNLDISIGLPQFKGFYLSQLRKAIRSSADQPERCSVLQNLHLTLPDTDTLAQNIGRSRKSHGLSGYFLAGSACAASLMILRRLTALKRLAITIPAVQSMTIWEFRAFWPALISYTRILEKMDIRIATSQDCELYFVEGDEKYLSDLEVDAHNIQHRVLGAMIIAGRQILTGQSPDEDLEAYMANGKPHDTMGMSDAGSFCYESITGTDVSVNKGRVREFLARSCYYIEEHEQRTSNA